jgi:uncharacterized protein YjbJ (UPF0337 family)
MPKKSTQDRAEGAIDKAKGRVKEAGGSLSGEGEKKAEGRAEHRESYGTERRLGAEFRRRHRPGCGTSHQDLEGRTGRVG